MTRPADRPDGPRRALAAPPPVDPALDRLAERVTGWSPGTEDDIEVVVGTAGPGFWDHMAELMAPPPPRPPTPPDTPWDPELRPGERLGPSLAELARSRSPGRFGPGRHPEVHEATEVVIKRQDAQRTERAERFPGWPWNEGGGVVHVYGG